MGRRAGRRAPAFAAIFAVLVLGGSAAAAPVTFNTALPVAKGEFVFREQIVLDRSGDDPGTGDRDRSAWTALSVLGYGIDGDLAVFGAVPVVERRLDATEDGARRGHSARGLGDLRLFARYTAWKNNFRGGSVRIAPFAGIETPTGSDDERDSFGAVPRGVQPGSGSWDPFGGIVVTYQTLAFQFDAQAGYQANTEAGGFAFGDVARLDGSAQLRLWPRTLGRGVPGFLYGVLEANLVHRERNESGGAALADSGGTTLFLVPGLQYVTRRWMVEGAVQVPVIENLNGTALEKDFVLRAGVRVNF